MMFKPMVGLLHLSDMHIVNVALSRILSLRTISASLLKVEKIFLGKSEFSS